MGHCNIICSISADFGRGGQNKGQREGQTNLAKPSTSREL